MDAHKSTIEQFFYGCDPLVVPVYQRLYTWKMDDCKQLLDDIYAIALNPKATHFVGSIVDVKHSNSIVLIDGQQRVTTISLLLLALRNALVNGTLAATDGSLIQRIENGFLINPFNVNEARVRLKPFRDDYRAFHALFDETEEFVKSSLVTSNYLFFAEKMKSLPFSPDLLFDAIKRLTIVRITLEPEYGDNAQLIFESINSTGVRLTEADKVRNFVLMNLDAETQESYFNKYWSLIETYTGNDLEDFIRYYLTTQLGRIPNKSDVYKEFKSYAAGKHDDGMEHLLFKMRTFAKIYKSIKTCQVGVSSVNEVMCNLEELDNTTSYPFLLSFLDYCESEGVTENEKLRVLKTIEVFLVRRTMKGLYNTGLNKIFMNLHKRVLQHIREGFTYADVMIYILENAISYYEFPNDDAFLQSFEVRDVYNMRKNYRLFLFSRLEESLNKESVNVKEKIETGLYTYEHIMPQTLTDDWRKEIGPNADEVHERWIHNIGNLTLTAYNSEYSNRPFCEKRDGIPTLPEMKSLRESCIAMNTWVSQCGHWTEEEIKCRCKQLANQALQLWPYPLTAFTPLVEEDALIPIDSDYSFKGSYIKYYSFRGARVDVASWADAFIRISRQFYEINPSILFSLCKDNGYYRTTLGDGYVPLVDGLYIYTSCNTEGKLNCIRKVMIQYGLDSDDISFALYSKRNPSITIDFPDNN